MMRLLLLLAFSLLFTSVAPNGEPLYSSCSSYSKAAPLQHTTTHAAGSIHLTLHHPRSRCSPAPLAPIPFSTVLRHDDAHAHSLISRILDRDTTTTSATKNKKTKKRKGKKEPSTTNSSSSSSSSSSPLNPGTSIGVGNYITKINLGTPPVPYVMVVDTGSSLTWLQCKPCKVSCHEQVGSIFDPTASRSYSPVPCSSSDCSSLASATLNPSGCSSSKVCVYEASYGDSSFSVGYLSRDTLSLGSLFVPNFIYGCGQDNEGLFGRSAGLIGLAKNRLSLLSQVSPKTGALAFSYCLPTASSTGALSFGPYSASSFAFTPMMTSSLDDSLYFIKLSGISVSGKLLSVSSSAYNIPTIIDSGTVITRLPSDVYSALSKAVASALSKYKRAPAYSILDTCFVGSVETIMVPDVAMVFQGGASIKLPGRNMLINVDSQTACMAFAPAGRVAIIGNRQQQTFSVVYDVSQEKIGFASGGCG